ncbi:nicotinate phosphoribosyltransferase [Candidatus Pacearchaeota archaeon]|nr:nicotinate phosphoribosyltransferase [Candidatus Pacearchaeota archaeon]
MISKMEKNNMTIVSETENRTMLTDLYQLTMMAAYHDNQKNDCATFDMFIRKLPKDWGFFIANGIDDAVDYTTNLGFESDDLEYLESQGLFKPEFLDYLSDFRFNGEIYAVKEGTPVCPNTPLLRLTGNRSEVQLAETMILNTVNFQTMIATKANRVVNAAGDSAVLDFGLRRAQERDAAIKGSRATYIGGCIGTSNVLAGKIYGIPIRGTHAHSFVMSHETERDAFRAYAKTFPNNPTLLVDTYDTLHGTRNAAEVMIELSGQLGAVRLDSGDLAKLSIEARKILDELGFPDAKIMASNDLNEYKIAELNVKGARIDGYGVGTEMITSKPVAAISGVYKIVCDSDGPKIKLSKGKVSYPGVKQVFRQEENKRFLYDVLALEGENVSGTPLLEKVCENGERIVKRRDLNTIRTYCLEQIAMLPEECKKLKATPYEMLKSKGLHMLVHKLSEKYGGGK